MDVLSELKIDPDSVRRTLTAFIRDELARVGFRKAVLGLSGGIDSAVVCYLAAEALGPENVLALTLPYATSTPNSLADALTVIAELGVQHQNVEITPMVDPLFAALPDMDKRRRGNAIARMRMIIWYDRSEAFGGLVLGTGNKTEILLGYSTIHGDSACAIVPIGDLYKTQVRQLATALGVPEPIRCKVPSADLWPGQTDEGELGLTYEVADCILYLLFDRGLSPAEVVAAGFSRQQVERVCSLVQRSQYKRCLPPVGKVSSCTVGREIPSQHDAIYWPGL
ncbi:MAG: NAD+ synthase [Anaerolineae bacterium]